MPRFGTPHVADQIETGQYPSYVADGIRAELQTLLEAVPAIIDSYRRHAGQIPRDGHYYSSEDVRHLLGLPDCHRARAGTPIRGSPGPGPAPIHGWNAQSAASPAA